MTMTEIALLSHNSKSTLSPYYAIHCAPNTDRLFGPQIYIYIFLPKIFAYLVTFTNNTLLLVKHHLHNLTDT